MDTQLPTRASRRATKFVVVAVALGAIGASMLVMSSVLAASTTAKPVITSGPSNPTNATNATLTFTDKASPVAFQCALDGAAFASCSSPQSYPGPLADGVHTFNVRALKPSSTVSAPAVYTWRVDTTSPAISSIVPLDPNPAKQGLLHWTVTFNEPVRNVGSANFGLTTVGVGGSAPAITGVAPVGAAPTATWKVTASASSSTATNGSIRLDLVGNSPVVDAAGNPLAGALPFAGQSYGFDTTAPALASINRADAHTASAGLLHWTATFSEPVSTVAPTDFGLTTSGLGGTAPSIASAAPVGSAPATAWTVTVDAAGSTAANGSIRLNLTTRGTIKDAARNLLKVKVPFTGQTYNFDSIAPAVTLTKVNGTAASFPYTSENDITSLGGACGTAAGDSSSVHVSIAGTAVQTAVVPCVSGAWSYTTSPALTDSGTYQAAATQGDTAGNTGSSGSRSLTIDHTILDFTISGGGVDSLYPGNDPQSLDLSITNPNNFAIKVTSITVSIQSETLNDTCSTADNFSIVQDLLTPVVITANSTQSLSDAGVAAGDRPQIQMLETHVNQDACKGVTIHFNYSGTAEKS